MKNINLILSNIIYKNAKSEVWKYLDEGKNDHLIGEYELGIIKDITFKASPSKTAKMIIMADYYNIPKNKVINDLLEIAKKLQNKAKEKAEKENPDIKIIL